MTSYFVAVDGESRGPYSHDQIAGQVRGGQIDAATLMWKEGMTDWAVAEQVLAGTGLLTQAPGLTPPLPPDAAHSAAAPEIQTPVIAAYGRRLAASLIDGFVLFVPVMVLVMLPHTLLPDISAFAVGELLALATSVAYYTLLQGRAEGATVGKRAVGIRVVRDNGEGLGIALALGRYVLLALFGMLLIPYLVPLFNSHRKGLHDMICGTVVIEGKRSEHPPLDLSNTMIGHWGALTWVMACLSLFVPVIGILAAISIPAYQDYVVRAKVALAIEQARDVSEKVVAYHTAHGQWPASATDLGLSRESEVAGVATMRVLPNGMVTLTFMRNPIQGIELDIVIDESGHRQCVSSLPRKYTGRACSPTGMSTPQSRSL
jgi:uncharacterized RDD family membrane protein YckC